MLTVVLHYSNGRSDTFQSSPDAVKRVMADYADADNNPYSFYRDVAWIEVTESAH